MPQDWRSHRGLYHYQGSPEIVRYTCGKMRGTLSRMQLGVIAGEIAQIGRAGMREGVSRGTPSPYSILRRRRFIYIGPTYPERAFRASRVPKPTLSFASSADCVRDDKSRALCLK